MPSLSKHGIEKLRGLWYKLRMMGMSLTGPSYIFGDNKSQVTNSTELNHPEKNATLFAIMLLENPLRWVNK